LIQQRGFHIGTIAGTPIHVEAGFLILIGIFVILALERRAPLESALLWVPIIFFSILLHEAGHAIAIGMLGYGSSHIFLTGFGGVTINRRRARPAHDMIISAAGPFTSILIWYFAGVAIEQFPAIRENVLLLSFVTLLRWANGAWAIFNLLPIHPLDGGHIFLNLARSFTFERRAAALSAWSSVAMAALLILYAVAARAIFLGVIAAMLAFQNYQRITLGRSGPPQDPAA
jgi:stage IV sporulation protein FB